MAVYEPRMDWLVEQLDSLNRQTYPNLRLYVRDDCSPTVSFKVIRACVEEHITAFPYELRRNEENLGSNGTFERLTMEAEGEYFAYCDQDDVWLPEKLSLLEEAIVSDRTVMSYCDMAVIDGFGGQIANSLKTFRPRLVYLQGSQLSERYFFRNCTAGCSMLIRAKTAKQAVPFPHRTVCDHWLAIIAAIDGNVSLVELPLVQYRQHANNQTGILTGVWDKQSYYDKRILPLEERLAAYRRYAQPSNELTAFVSGRMAGHLPTIWRYRAFSPYEAKAEIALKFLPEWVFVKCLEGRK